MDTTPHSRQPWTPPAGWQPTWPGGTTGTVISTRRRAPSGTVHEMAERGVLALCGRSLAEPWQWTDDPTTCRRCLARKAATDA